MALATCAGGAEPTARVVGLWLGEPKGMTEGRLCSLALQVEVGKTLDLVINGGSRDAGWGKIGPTKIPLGSIGLSHGIEAEKIERSGDSSYARVKAHVAGGGEITVWATQMWPGLDIATSTGGLRLFAGRHERFIDPNAKYGNWVTGFPGGQNRQYGTITPGWVAVPAGNGIKAAAIGEAIPLPPKDQPWMLVGWGKATHFVRSDLPLSGRGRHSDAYRADCPLLLVFDAAPQKITVAADGGLDFTLAEKYQRVVVLPLFGAKLVRADETQKWLEAFPDDVAARCRRLGKFGQYYPICVHDEMFRYDAAKDEAVFEETICPPRPGLAPLPPIAALAMKKGMAISVSKPLTDLDMVTEFGPIVGVAGNNEYSWSVKGLAKYVNFADDARGQGAVPAELQAELAEQVQRMLEAGPLRPWTYCDNLPIGDYRGEYYWGEPGEAMYLLSAIYPALEQGQQKQLLRYMGELRAAHPPEREALIPPDEGNPRGGFDLGPCRVSKALVKERGQRVSLFALYGLERYLTLAGQKPDEKCWTACKVVLDDACEEQAWGTLYLLGHPDRRVPWMKDSARDAATPSWRGDRVAAVVNANRTFAGAIGAIRLARMMGDRKTEQQAWWLLARAAVLRYAMGKLPAWRYEAQLAVLPADPQWEWKLDAGDWHGRLQTPDWSKPEHDVRQIIELAPDGPRLGDHAGTNGDWWQQEVTAQLVAFRYMVPELAAFLRDHLRSETAALNDRIELNLPTWYASFSEAILGAEHNTNHPSDAFEQFLARAQILDEDPQRLARWIDVPWVERGDLFYLNKLAEAIKAHRRR